MPVNICSLYHAFPLLSPTQSTVEYTQNQMLKTAKHKAKETNMNQSTQESNSPSKSINSDSEYPLPIIMEDTAVHRWCFYLSISNCQTLNSTNYRYYLDPEKTH